MPLALAMRRIQVVLVETAENTDFWTAEKS